MLVHNGQYYREENLNEHKHCSDGTASGHFICLPDSVDGGGAVRCTLKKRCHTCPRRGKSTDGHRVLSAMARMQVQQQEGKVRLNALPVGRFEATLQANGGTHDGRSARRTEHSAHL